jgi:hypothetical protein
MKSVGRVAAALGVLFGSLSLFQLVQQGWDLGLAAILETLLSYYRHAVGFVLDPIEPILLWVLDEIERAMRIQLDLYPHWKHVFVPMSLYIGAEVRVTWPMAGLERKIAAVAIAVYGGAIALAASIASGTIPVNDPNPLFVVYPAVAIIAYNVVQTLWNATFHRYPGNTWLQSFRYYSVVLILSSALISGVAVVVSLLVPRTESQNTLMLLLLVALLALRNVGLAAGIAHLQPRARPIEGVTFAERFRRLPHRQIGTWILLCLAGVIWWLVLNAGLQL